MSSDLWDVSDACDAEEALAHVDDDLKFLAKYKRQALPFVAEFEKIADALETKRILLYADRIQQRIDEVTELERLLRGADALVVAFERGFEKLVSGDRKGNREQALDALGEKLLERAKLMVEYEERISDQDNGEERYIDWTLEDFITDEAKIQRKLEQRRPVDSLMEDDYLGSRSLHGVLVYYDAEYLQSRIDEETEES